MVKEEKQKHVQHVMEPDIKEQFKEQYSARSKQQLLAETAKEQEKQ